MTTLPTLRRWRVGWRRIWPVLIALLALFALIVAYSRQPAAVASPHASVQKASKASTGSLTAAPGYEWIDAADKLAWPLTALALGAIALSPWGRRTLSPVFGSVRKVSAGGLELEFSETRAREVRQRLDSLFDSYRRRAGDEFDALARKYDVPRMVHNLCKHHIEPALQNNAAKSYRCTVYVPDLILDEGLYQLVDYFPTGTGRGRVIPPRLGLVGRAFRAEDSQCDVKVPIAEEDLIRDWGMTLEEAGRKGRDRGSFACVIVKDDLDRAAGGIYIDATPQLAFGKTQPEADVWIAKLEAACQGVGLHKALIAISEEVRDRGTRIPVFAKPI